MKKVDLFAGTEYMDYFIYSTAYVYDNEWWKLHTLKKVVSDFKLRPNGYEGFQ